MPDARTQMRLVAAAAAFAAALGAWFMLTRRADRAMNVRPGSTTRLTSDPGMELDPALSPDGATLAYSAGPPGRTRIRLRQLADGSTRSLTSGDTTAAERWPQWSADGTQIVFQAAAPQPETATSDSSPHLYIVPSTGGVPRLVLGPASMSRAFAPAWHPHQAAVVFGGPGGVYSFELAGGREPQLQASGIDTHSPRWSPDGQWLAYIENGLGYAFGGDTLGIPSASRLILHPVHSAAKIALTDGNALDTNPVWLPDSRTILFISTRGGGRDIFQLRIGPQGSTGEDPQRWASKLDVHTMSIAPDGTRLLYSSYPPGAAIWSVAVPSTGAASMADATRLTSAGEMIEKLALSPDGRTLAFDSNREGQFDVWKMPAAGGAAQRITRSPDNEYVNDWSPDGRELVIHAVRNHQRDLLVIPVDGSSADPVATTPLQEHHAGWGPDGNSIVYDAPPKAGARGQAFVATRTARGAPWGSPRQVTRNGSGDPKWSPDGRLIAFCVDYELRVIAPDGSGERTVFNGKSDHDLQEPNYPVWSRDSRTIYFRIYDRSGQSSIWSIGLDGAPPRLLIRFDDPSHRSLRREFATDGTRLYFTVSRDESDIWQMDLNR